MFFYIITHPRNSGPGLYTKIKAVQEIQKRKNPPGRERDFLAPISQCR
jgi:hypothetical protein